MRRVPSQVIRTDEAPRESLCPEGFLFACASNGFISHHPGIVQVSWALLESGLRSISEVEETGRDGCLRRDEGHVLALWEAKGITRNKEGKRFGEQFVINCVAARHNDFRGRRLTPGFIAGLPPKDKSRIMAQPLPIRGGQP